jgi:hypothetical protein
LSIIWKYFAGTAVNALAGLRACCGRFTSPLRFVAIAGALAASPAPPCRLARGEIPLSKALDECGGICAATFYRRLAEHRAAGDSTR